MSAVALNNRVTSDSNSDAVFASCTTLPIHQTMLNVEEMADIDGLGYGETLDATIDYISQAIGAIRECASYFDRALYTHFTGKEPEETPAAPAPPPPPPPKPRWGPCNCNRIIVFTSYGTCLCNTPW